MKVQYCNYFRYPDPAGTELASRIQICDSDLRIRNSDLRIRGPGSRSEINIYESGTHRIKHGPCFLGSGPFQTFDQKDPCFQGLDHSRASTSRSRSLTKKRYPTWYGSWQFQTSGWIYSTVYRRKSRVYPDVPYTLSVTDFYKSMFLMSFKITEIE